VNATVHFEIDDPRGDNVDGHANITGTETSVSSSCSGPLPPDRPVQWFLRFSGPDSGFRGTESSTFSGPTTTGDTAQGTFTTTFEGARAGDTTITGTVKIENRGVSTNNAGVMFDFESAATFPLTVTKS
jgi:hypothetical protein